MQRLNHTNILGFNSDTINNIFAECIGTIKPAIM